MRNRGTLAILRYLGEDLVRAISGGFHAQFRLERSFSFGQYIHQRRAAFRPSRDQAGIVAIRGRSKRFARIGRGGSSTFIRIDARQAAVIYITLVFLNR